MTLPYGYRMDDWVVFWCTILILEIKEKLFILLFKVVFQIPITKLHWSNCEMKINDTNKNYFNQVMINHQD